MADRKIPYERCLMPSFILFFALISVLLVTAGCKQKDVYIPQEGDVVTWKHSSELVIKAKLGQRREHVVADPRTDYRFYEPQYERFIGQFPIDYDPEPFPKFTEEELAAFEAKHASKIPSPKSGHPLEFSLMLNGVKAVVTDRSIHSSEALVDVNQIKIVLGGDRGSKKTAVLYEGFKASGKGVYDQKLSLEYGLDCYASKSSTTGGFLCFGESNFKGVSGVFYERMSNGWVYGKSIEPIYGGIRVRYRMHLNSLKQWREIDAAIWRLLAGWNVSPLVTPIQG